MVSLAIWTPPGGSNFPMVFVHGFPGMPAGGKAHLSLRGGMVRVGLKGDTGNVTAEAILSAVYASLPRGETSWEAILACAANSPAPRRGPPPGSRASSRRGNPTWREPHLPLPTAASFENFDPGLATQPLPEPTTLLVDDQEPAEVVDLLRTVANLDVQVAKLEVGDYVVPGRLAIERKTIHDFVVSVGGDDKRLFHQAAALNRSGMAELVILEGDPYAQNSMTIKAVDGFLTYLMLIRRIPAFTTKSRTHTAQVVAKAVRHAVYGLGYPDPGSSAPAAPDPSKAGAYLLTCLPGVSATIAGRLLEKFGSVRGVCAAAEGELREVQGVGPAVAASILRTLGGDLVSMKGVTKRPRIMR